MYQPGWTWLCKDNKSPQNLRNTEFISYSCYLSIMCQLSGFTLNIPKERVSLRDIPFLCCCCHNYQHRSEQSECALTLRILWPKCQMNMFSFKGAMSAVLPVAWRKGKHLELCFDDCPREELQCRSSIIRKLRKRKEGGLTSEKKRVLYVDGQEEIYYRSNF